MTQAPGGQRRTRVLNSGIAEIQITAEQLMREAWERQEHEPKPPRQKISDEQELEEYQMRKRVEFENSIRQKKQSINIWLRYAKWEESQNEWERARSIYERTISIDYKNVGVWLKYAELEMRNKNINLARNVWDRAVALLPRASALWYKYIFMEEKIHNFAGVRRLYERWMEWEPDEMAWYAYIAFEKKNGELELVRGVFRRFIKVHHNVKVWIKFAKFEEKLGELENARQIYEESLDVFSDNPEKLVEIYIAFADFEEKMKEIERTRTIYRYALDRIPKSVARKLFDKFIRFEKQYGDRDNIELIIIGKRRFQYEELLLEDGRNYDIWFDYIRLEEATGDQDRIREVYERAISSDNMPPIMEKHYWKRYIFIWINYALYEELIAKDFDRTREIYKTLLNLIPHKRFSFNKLWIMFANFEIRRRNLEAARRIYGHALGVAPTDKIFTSYVELEMQLANIDRCRKLYTRWLEMAPENCTAWIKFAELEADPQIQEIERARGIFELAVQQPILDMPELLWKAYIDFELDNQDYSRARALYKRLLERTKHVRVWVSWAKFEMQHIGDVERARTVYKEAFASLKPIEFTEQRVLLIESWRDFEEEHGTSSTREMIRNNMPKRVIKRRKLTTADGQDAGYEEYYDYIFPDTQNVRAGLKLMEAAKRWKEKQHHQQLQETQ